MMPLMTLWVEREVDSIWPVKIHFYKTAFQRSELIYDEVMRVDRSSLLFRCDMIHQ